MDHYHFVLVMFIFFDIIGCVLIFNYIKLIKEINETNKLIQKRTERLIKTLKDF